MRNQANYLQPRNQHFPMKNSKFSIDHRSTKQGDVNNIKSALPINRVAMNVANNVTSTSYSRSVVTSFQSEKIYYNPNFVDRTKSCISSSNGRNIHVNPNFVKPQTSQINSLQEFNKKIDQSDHQRSVHFNPRFFEKQNASSQAGTIPVLPSSSGSNRASSFKMSKYSLDKRPRCPSSSPSLIKQQFTLRKPLVSQFDCKGKPVAPSSFNKPQQIIRKQVPPHISKHRTSLNSKYKKINTINCQGCSNTKIVKSKYSIRRVPLKQITPNKPVLNLTPGSYRKIGKRKLIRKSLLQKYISYRRFSTSYSNYKMRNIAHKKVVRSQLTPVNHFKVPPPRRNDTRTKYKIDSRNKSKYSKDNRTKPLQNSEFLKIGKRKIVRKSIISSIIAARRKASISLKSKLVSRYKIRKISKVPQSHSESKRVIPARKTAVWNSQPVQLAKMSRSVMFRMRPNVRLRVKMEVKKLALLKKNNAKCSFYNRFGHCKGKDDGSCKKVHDPKSIAVCKKYLLGECTDNGCKLNHTKSKEKMPTCHQFLAGVCVRDNCPFLHVKLHAASSICRDFLGGFCPNGKSCSKRHVFICPDWEIGKCPRKVCPYPHPKNVALPKRQRRVSAKLKPTSEKLLESEVITDPTDRYFNGAELGSIEIEVLNDSQENIEGNKNTESEQKKSVYEDESLLSFIPFSSN